MVTKELLDYVKSELQRGQDENSIRTTLIKSNWSEQDINQAFLSLQQPSSLPTPPSPTTPDVARLQEVKSESNRTLITVIALFLLYPIGLILMWIWTKWKKWLKILITIPLILIIISIPLLAYFGNKYDTESKAYVDSVIPKIINSWDVRELTSQESREFQQVVKSDEINAMFITLSNKLGPLKNYNGSKGEAKFNIPPVSGHIVTSTYMIDATFEKAPAQIKVSAVMNNGKWSILEFRVYSDALIK